MTKSENIINKTHITFLISFGQLKDPRVPGLVKYPLDELLFGVLCALICGCDDFEEIELFVDENLEYLRKYFPYKHGFPKEAWLSRLFSMINSAEFEQSLMKWLSYIQRDLKGVIAIDGKTVRGSKSANKKPIHIISAFLHERGLIIGQKKVEEKTNEITAIPTLLDQINIEGSIITIDAMGCQKKIADKIIEKKADYVLSLKDNHANFLADVEKFFSFHEKFNFKERGYDFEIFEENDAGHGRVERRKVITTSDISWLKIDHPDWKGLTSITMVESSRFIKNKNLSETIERRYYISSLPSNAKTIANAIRSHWSIENNLHYLLDVAFYDDKCRSRKDHASLNFAIMRRIAYNIIKLDKSTKRSIKCKRKKAGWSNAYLTTLLNNFII